MDDLRSPVWTKSSGWIVVYLLVLGIAIQTCQASNSTGETVLVLVSSSSIAPSTSSVSSTPGIISSSIQPSSSVLATTTTTSSTKWLITSLGSTWSPMETYTTHLNIANSTSASIAPTTTSSPQSTHGVELPTTTDKSLVTTKGNTDHGGDHGSGKTTDHSTGNKTDHATSGGGGHAPAGEHGGHKSSGGVVLIPINFHHVEYPMIFTIVVLFAVLCKLLFHYSHFLASKVPESCVLIVIGLICGAVLHYSGATKEITLFEPAEFFLFLLPPIILEAAYSLHDPTFAENIGGVLLFAVLGTILNFVFIGFSMYGLYIVGAMEEVHTTLVHMLLFSALIVAVDPVAVLAVFQEIGVNNVLYFLVFGESLLNDGVTVVLYNVMQTFNTLPEITGMQIFLGIAKFFIVCFFATLIGFVFGIVSSWITRFTNSVKVIEPIVVFGFAYLSYLLSDLFQFSGIVSIIVCGIIQAHYSFLNVHKKSKQTIIFCSKVMATTCEIVIFLFLGIVTMDQEHDWKTGFSLWALLLCTIYRFLVTFGLSVWINRSARVRRVRYDEMFMISYGGLRGAICFSLVISIAKDEVPMKELFVTTTLFIIFFTVFIQGGTIKWLVNKLKISLAASKDTNVSEELVARVFEHVTAGIEQILGYTTGEHHIKMKLTHIDNKYLRPAIMRDATQSHLTDLKLTYERLVMKEHYKSLQLSGAKLPRVKTEIRHLDSELALEKLGNSDFRPPTHSLNGLPSREYNKYSSTMRFYVGDESDADVETHNHKQYDPVEEPTTSKKESKKGTIASYLSKKHRKNKKLLDMRRSSAQPGSPKIPTSLSFNLDGTRAFDEDSDQETTNTKQKYREEDETRYDKPPAYGTYANGHYANGHANPAFLNDATDDSRCDEEDNGRAKFSF